MKRFIVLSTILTALFGSSYAVARADSDDDQSSQPQVEMSQTSASHMKEAVIEHPKHDSSTTDNHEKARTTTKVSSTTQPSTSGHHDADTKHQTSEDDYSATTAKTPSTSTTKSTKASHHRASNAQRIAATKKAKIRIAHATLTLQAAQKTKHKSTIKSVQQQLKQANANLLKIELP